MRPQSSRGPLLRTKRVMRMHLVSQTWDMTEILSCFLAIEHRGYFGPRSRAPTKEGLQRPISKNKRDVASKYIVKASKLRSTSIDPISNVVRIQ